MNSIEIPDLNRMRESVAGGNDLIGAAVIYPSLSACNLLALQMFTGALQAELRREGISYKHHGGIPGRVFMVSIAEVPERGHAIRAWRSAIDSLGLTQFAEAAWFDASEGIWRTAFRATERSSGFEWFLSPENFRDAKAIIEEQLAFAHAAEQFWRERFKG